MWNVFYLSFIFVVTYIALFICAIATGIVYVAGLSYVNIRAEKQERHMRIALCHAWKMIGFGIVFSLYLYLLEGTGSPVGDTLNKFYQIIGYIILASSGIFIVLLLLNEYRQRQGLIYNYRDCLDHDNSIANNYCKLLSKNEVIVERNPTVSAAGMWKSTENLLPRNKKNFTNLWTIYLMLPKLHGAVMFHFFLVTITFAASDGYIYWIYAKGIVVWIMVIGSINGCFLLRIMQGAKVYTLTSTIAITSLGVSYIFFNNKNQIITIFLWIYFFATSTSIAVPDISLMEVAKIRFSEGALAIGFFLEIIPIAVLQSTQRDAYDLAHYDWYTNQYYLPAIISTIVILVVTSLVYQLHMPNTHNKSLLQIQNELLKSKKYFAFDFDNEVNSAVPRRSSENSRYSTDNNVNVFENHAKNISEANTPASPTDYSEVMERLPDPPVNKVTNFDYNKEIPKPPSIIPRVNIAMSSTNSLYSSSHGKYN